MVAYSNKIQNNIFEELIVTVVEEAIIDEESAILYLKSLKIGVAKKL